MRFVIRHGRTPGEQPAPDIADFSGEHKAARRARVDGRIQPALSAKVCLALFEGLLAHG